MHEHARKLVEKYTGEPWFEGKYTNKPRMRPNTMLEGLHWLDNNFVLIRHEDDEMPSVDWILGLARSAVMRHGIRGGVGRSKSIMKDNPAVFFFLFLFPRGGMRGGRGKEEGRKGGVRIVYPGDRACTKG